MILPTKHISPENTLLGCGAIIIEKLDKPKTVSQLWQESKRDTIIGNYERFVLVLDMLFILGILIIESGLVKRLE